MSINIIRNVKHKIRNRLPRERRILMCPSLSDLSTTLKILLSNVAVKGTCGLFAIASKRA